MRRGPCSTWNTEIENVRKGVLRLVPLVLCLVLLLSLLFSGRSLRGTTLMAARWWAIGAAALLLWVESDVWKGSATGDRPLTLRYLVSIGTFCPIMAVLGAKRPQSGPWQMIVLSLWFVLALPAAESFFVRRGAAVQIHDVRGWFLWVLMGVGCLNYVGTRHGIASIVAMTGQVLLLGEHLPLLHLSVGYWSVSTAYGLFITAIAMVWARSRPPPTSIHEAWARFQDRYGVFWSFRIAERFNSQAVASAWPCRVGHFGMYAAEARPSADDGAILAEVDVPVPARKLLYSLLSRFESDESLAEIVPSVH